MSRALPHIAFALFAALPLIGLGSALTRPAADPCPVIEVTDSATVADWQDAQLSAELEARANGCATIQAVRG